MHVRLSDVRGSSIVDDQTLFVVATLGDPLIHPDTGRIEGFFVYGYSPDASGQLFLLSQDILSWGSSLHVRSSAVLSPPGDLIRLQPLFSDTRQFLGHRIRVEGDRTLLGTCHDIQFDTRHLVVEWLFPRKYFWYRQPLPASDILEVTDEAIWIRHPLRLTKEKIESSEIEQTVTPALVPEIFPAQTRRRE